MSASEQKEFRSTLLKGALLLGFCAGMLLVLFVSRAEDQMEIISLRHWLDAEVNQYYRQYRKNPDTVRLPNPYEFDSYWSEKNPPAWLQEYQTPGFFEHHLGAEDKHFRVVRHPSGTGLFYLVFKDDADDYLDQYESKLHWTSFLMALLTCAATALSVLFLVGRIAHPFKQVLVKIRQMKPTAPDFSVDAPYEELRQIEAALLHSKQEIRSYFQREQEFSRFASHEIRTPLTVMRGSIDLLKKMEFEAGPAQRATLRLDAACDDMTLLTELFLLLGKNTIEEQRFQTQSLRRQVEDILTRVKEGNLRKTRDITLMVEADTEVNAPGVMLHVLLFNLVRNAIDHGMGTPCVTLRENQIDVVNSIDTEADNQGFGYGTIIIGRIADRLGWTVTSQIKGDIYSATVKFLPIDTVEDRVSEN